MMFFFSVLDGVGGVLGSNLVKKEFSKSKRRGIAALGREGMDWKSGFVFVGNLKGGDLGRKCFGVDVEDVSKSSECCR